MTEQIKHEADVFAEELIKHKIANHDIFVKEEVKKEIVSVYTAGAKKATKICNEYYQNELYDLYKDYEKRLDGLKGELADAKDIIRELVKNSPDTYSGTNIELQQKKMFAFQNVVNKAEAFLKE